MEQRSVPHHHLGLRYSIVLNGVVSVCFEYSVGGGMCNSITVMLIIHLTNPLHSPWVTANLRPAEPNSRGKA